MSAGQTGARPTPKRWAAGDTFTFERTCGRYTPYYYAAVSGDFNALHLDAELARTAGLPGNILHGMCTFAWLAEACVEYLGDPARLRRLRVRFSRPLQAGDVVTFEGRCTAISGGTLALELAARNQAGEEVLKGAVAEARVEA